jgi:polysaccharide export outer membrane protein
MEIPEYRLQNRDVLNITVKAMDPEGKIVDFHAGSGSSASGNYMQNEGGSYLYGYNINKDGNIIIPVLGEVSVIGKTLEEVRSVLQEKFKGTYKNAVVECKLLSFKYTVIGEVKTPGTFVNYNNYLTVLEAVGRAGGIADFGRRDRVLVVRAQENGTKTYSLNLQDKSILNSEAYFLLPNDVIIVEPQKSKIFNMNLPVISFMVTTATAAITTTLLLINYIK